MGGWGTSSSKVTKSKVTTPKKTSGWVGGGTATVGRSPSISTFPIGQDLIGFQSLTPSQQSASSALLSNLRQGMQSTPTFNVPAYQTPAKLPAAPAVPNLAPAPITMPTFAYEGVNPADVGNIQDILATLPEMSPEVKQTLNTLMEGASATPEQTLEEILASIPTFGGDLGEETRGAMERALSGEFPEEYFKSSIADPARRTFEEKTAPAIREEFVGPGTYWGGERAGAVTDELANVENNLTAIRGELGNQAQIRSLEAAATSMSARQNQISLAIQELTAQRSYASAQQVTALNAAITELQNQQDNNNIAQAELNRLSNGKYQEIALATERWGKEVGVLQQGQELGQRGKIAQAQLGQDAWSTALQGQLAQQGQNLQQWQVKVQTAFNAYVHKNPSASEYLQTALSYLNIPMLSAYQPYQ